MTASPDSTRIMLQQHCNQNPVREDQNSVYTGFPISKMISAANSAAALSATSKATYNNPLSASTLAPVSSTKFESSGFGTSSMSLELTNNTKTIKKLSFSSNTLMTSKERKSSIFSEGVENRRTTFPDKKSVKLLEKERAEGVRVGGEDICKSQNGDMGEDGDEKTLLGE